MKERGGAVLVGGEVVVRGLGVFEVGDVGREFGEKEGGACFSCHAFFFCFCAF